MNWILFYSATGGLILFILSMILIKIYFYSTRNDKQEIQKTILIKYQVNPVILSNKISCAIKLNCSLNEVGIGRER